MISRIIVTVPGVPVWKHRQCTPLLSAPKCVGTLHHPHKALHILERCYNIGKQYQIVAGNRGFGIADGHLFKRYSGTSATPCPTSGICRLATSSPQLMPNLSCRMTEWLSYARINAMRKYMNLNIHLNCMQVADSNRWYFILIVVSQPY